MINCVILVLFCWDFTGNSTVSISAKWCNKNKRRGGPGESVRDRNWEFTKVLRGFDEDSMGIEGG